MTENGKTSTMAFRGVDFVLRPTVDFRVVKEIPKHLLPQMNAAVQGFMEDSHLPRGLDRQGFYEQTIESIAACTFLNTPGRELWIGTLGDELVTYVMAAITREVDNRLTYWISQAWVRKDQRRQKWVRDAWQKIRTRAKETFCSHIIVVSSRNDAAYCRWLGKGWHRYGGLLKEDM